jgi:SAM-dependent methyltransferase
VSVSGGASQQRDPDPAHLVVGPDGASVPNLESQTRFWNSWNVCRVVEPGNASRRQREVVSGWLDELRRRDLRILEVGCGAGWLIPTLLEFGEVTANDLADEMLDRASAAHPTVRFLAGDVMDLDLEPASFDVVICLEVLSHVADQRALIERLASLTRVGGKLMLATQNRPVLEKHNDIPPPGPGQIRKWLDEHELRGLLGPDYDVLELTTVAPVANRGPRRILNSRKLNRPLHAIVGDRVDRLKERRGWGGTLMCLAQRT